MPFVDFYKKKKAAMCMNINKQTKKVKQKHAGAMCEELSTLLLLP